MKNIKFQNKGKVLQEFNSNSPGFQDKDHHGSLKSPISTRGSPVITRCSEKTLKFNNENINLASPLTQKFRSNTIFPRGSRKNSRAATKDPTLDGFQATREVLVEDFNIEIDLSSINVSPQKFHLEKQLEEMKVQIKNMNERLSIDEKSLQQKNLEYDYLRNTIFSLQNQLDSVRVSRGLKTDHSLCCDNCMVI